MSFSTDLTARETEIIRIIKTLTQRTRGFVVIGSYAVNALGQHRFSVDCDLAADRQHLPAIGRILQREGYAKAPRSGSRSLRGVVVETYARRMGRERASVELYVDRVVCRQTGGAWSYGLMAERSIEALVVGVTDSTATRVPLRELLAAMKLHAGRGQDLADLVMLSERMDWETMARFAACGSREKVSMQLESATAKIGTSKFESDLRSAFALRAEVEPLIKRAIRGLERVTSRLPGLDFNQQL